MKKPAAILTALALLLCMSAFALSGTDYPVWDGSSVPKNSLYGSIGGQNLIMELDTTAEYSNVVDGMAQICFFAFDKAEQNYLEMYVLLPENAAAGDVFSPTSGGLSSISLYEVSKDSEELYFSGQVSGFAYPSGSSFELCIDSAQKSDAALSMSGTLDGTLVKFKDNVPTEETLILSGVKFDFSLPLSGNRAPQPGIEPNAPVQPLPSVQPVPSFQPNPSSMPQLPAPTAVPKAVQPTMDPHPAFTLPPDYAIL